MFTVCYLKAIILNPYVLHIMSLQPHAHHRYMLQKQKMKVKLSLSLFRPKPILHQEQEPAYCLPFKQHFWVVLPPFGQIVREKSLRRV